MSKQKLTQWFTNGEKPWEPGVYEVRGAYVDGLFAYWGPKGWGSADTTKRAAYRGRNNGLNPDCYHTNGRYWRGLAHPPKAKP